MSPDDETIREPPAGTPLEAPHPKVIAGTEIIRKLGSGGMGDVYLARQANLERLIALKVLKPEAAGSAELVARFHREAKSAALTHNSIVHIYDSGTIDGVSFIKMAYMAGGSLRDVLRARGRLSPAEAVRVGAQIGRALSYVHSSNVIHRDVKPSNVLLDQEGNCYLTDFGIAFDPKSDRLTKWQGRVGTPEYMAPEIVSGTVPAGPASDVYALAVTLFECLTGSPPFTGELDVQVMYQQRYDPVPPMPDVPARLAAVIRRGLSKDPGDRPESAIVFADELLQAHGSAPVSPAAPADPGSPDLSTATHLPLPLVTEAAVGVPGSRGELPTEIEAPQTGASSGITLIEETPGARPEAPAHPGPRAGRARLIARLTVMVMLLSGGLVYVLAGSGCEPEPVAAKSPSASPSVVENLGSSTVVRVEGVGAFTPTGSAVPVHRDSVTRTPYPAGLVSDGNAGGNAWVTTARTVDLRFRFAARPRFQIESVTMAMQVHPSSKPGRFETVTVVGVGRLDLEVPAGTKGRTIRSIRAGLPRPVRSDRLTLRLEDPTGDVSGLFEVTFRGRPVTVRKVVPPKPSVGATPTSKSSKAKAAASRTPAPSTAADGCAPSGDGPTPSGTGTARPKGARARAITLGER